MTISPAAFASDASKPWMTVAVYGGTVNAQRHATEAQAKAWIARDQASEAADEHTGTTYGTFRAA